MLPVATKLSAGPVSSRAVKFGDVDEPAAVKENTLPMPPALTTAVGLGQQPSPPLLGLRSPTNAKAVGGGGHRCG